MASYKFTIPIETAEMLYVGLFSGRVDRKLKVKEEQD
jgi:hypothetical protein